MRSILLTAAACYLGLALVAPNCARGQGKEWAKYRSENFMLYTASSQGKARRVLQHLERVRNAYTYLLNTELGGGEPVNVVLFRDADEYEGYSRSELSHAYYASARGRDYIVVSDFTPQIERALNHEYFHLYSRHEGYRWPPWAREGFADYFSTLRITGKRLEVGQIVEGHMIYLRRGEAKMTSEQLFQMTSDDRHSAGRRDVADLYAMSWALVHFIFSDPEYQDRAGAMTGALQQSDDSAVAFERVYGWDLEEIDERLQEYVNRPRMGYRRLDVPGLDIEVETGLAEMQPWEAPLILADLKAFSRHTNEAKLEYERLSVLHPDRPEIDDSLAVLHMIDGDREGAAPYLRSAVEKGSANPDTYKLLAYEDCAGGSVPEHCSDLVGRAAEMAPEDRPLQFFNISTLVRAENFTKALLTANKMGKVTAAEAPRFFYEVAYAQYRIGQLEDAKKSIEAALKYVDSPFERQRMEQFESMLAAGPAAQVAQAAAFDAQGELEIEPEELQRRETETRWERPETPPSVESLAQRLVNSLAESGVQFAEGSVRELDCSASPVFLSVESDGEMLKLQIDSPSEISIIRDGLIVNDYQFTCGAQSGEALRVGFVGDGAGGSAKYLRLLQFGEAR